MSADPIESARKWLGTPFLAGASVRGVGCDCAGLIEAISHDMGVAYPPRHAVQHNILAAALAFLVPVTNPLAGSIVLLSAQPGTTPLHAALITDTNTLIHAHWRAGVVENRFGGWFARRVTHVFSWPTLTITQEI